MAGSMSMEGAQAERTLAALRGVAPEAEEAWRRLYAWRPGSSPSYGPSSLYSHRVARLVRETCARHGLGYRMPRPTPETVYGDLTGNKRLAERLFLKCYDLEIEEATSHLVWAYRKAAWAVDEMEVSLPALWRSQGPAALTTIGVTSTGPAREIAGWLGEAGALEGRAVS
jgi:hypothetical protein